MCLLIVCRLSHDAFGRTLFHFSRQSSSSSMLFFLPIINNKKNNDDDDVPILLLLLLDYLLYYISFISFLTVAGDPAPQAWA